jgi:methyl coenzyme M reductase beta subunit
VSQKFAYIPLVFSAGSSSFFGNRIYGFAGAPSEAEGTHLITPRSERKSFAIFCMELLRHDT